MRLCQLTWNEHLAPKREPAFNYLTQFNARRSDKHEHLYSVDFLSLFLKFQVINHSWRIHQVCLNLMCRRSYYCVASSSPPAAHHRSRASHSAGVVPNNYRGPQPTQRALDPSQLSSELARRRKLCSLPLVQARSQGEILPLWITRASLVTCDTSSSPDISFSKWAVSLQIKRT